MNEPADSWYPSCVVKLTIRYDESLHILRPKDEVSLDAQAAQTPEGRVLGENTSASPSGQQTLQTGSHRPRSQLDSISATNDALAGGDQHLPSSALPPGFKPIVRKQAGGIAIAEMEPLTFGTDAFTVIANRVPRKGTFTLPHPRSAPTFTMIFDYVEFPVDPRILRGVGVEIHLGAVPAEDFARGMAGEVDEDGRPLSILKTTDDIVDPVTGRKHVNNGTLLFYGTCDTWDVEHAENGSTIIIEGREVRHILIDTKIVASQVDKVNLNQPIDIVIADLIQTIQFENGLRLTTATDATEWPDGIVPAPGDADGLTRVRIKAASRSGAKTRATLASGSDPGVQTGDKASARSNPETGGKTSYWDLITNYCQLVGAMPYIVGSMLWVRPIHRIFDVVDPQSKIPTPFAKGEPRLAGDEVLRVRRLVIGRDIRRIRTQRKFGGAAIVPTVQTISYDDRAVGLQRLIFGQWPPKGSDAAESKAEAELLRLPVWGVRSVERLTQIARGIYEEVGRGETGGSAETSVLASFGGDNGDPDLLRLRPLEPIEFVVDATALRSALPIVADVNELASLSFSEEVERLHQMIGDRAVARAMVGLSRGVVAEVIRYFQVVGVTFEWDRGVRTSLAFQNYIIARHNATAVSDQDVTKEIVARPVKVAGGGRKARAKAKPKVRVVFSNFERVEPPTGEPSRRPRELTAKQADLLDSSRIGNL